MAKKLIKGARIIIPGQKRLKECDVLLENGKIKKIDKNIKSTMTETIKAKGKFLFPGLIDMHVHFRDPGREDEEDLISGSRAALAGGYTSVAVMPNTDPVVDNLSVLQYILEKSEKCKIDIYPIAAQTIGQKGDCLSEMIELAENGAIAFSDDGNCVQSSRVMRRVMEYAKMVKRPLIIHAEDENLSRSGMINEGYFYSTGFKRNTKCGRRSDYC